MRMARSIRMLVGRIGVVATVVLTAPAMASDPATTLVGDAVAGQARYARACARCHRDPTEILQHINWVLADKTIESREVWLRDFVTNHHNPGAEATVNIAAYLAGISGS